MELRKLSQVELNAEASWLAAIKKNIALQSLYSNVIKVKCFYQLKSNPITKTTVNLTVQFNYATDYKAARASCLVFI